MAERKKRKITQEDVARACGIDQGSVSRILNSDTRDSFAEDTVQKVFQTAREIGYLHHTLVNSNRRGSPRKKAGIPTRIQIVIGNTTVFDEGDAHIAEVSSTGMMLDNFRTKKQALPLDRFRIDAEVLNGKLRGFKCRGRIVRFTSGFEDFGIAVAFDTLDEQSKETLKSFLK